MEHNNELIKNFGDALAVFNKMVKLLQKRVYALNDDIEANTEFIQNAYYEIKKDYAELSDIYNATSGAMATAETVCEEANNIASDCSNLIEKMFPLVKDGYIDDEDDLLVKDSGEEEERDEEDKKDYIATDNN